MPHRKEDGKPQVFKENFTQKAIDEAERANKYLPPDEIAPDGFFDGRPILGRHTPRINGGVDYLGRHRLAVIIDDAFDPVILQTYARLQAELRKEDSFFRRKKGLMRRVYEVTKKAMPYDLDKEDKFDAMHQGIGRDSAYLGSYINNKAGVCREQALFLDICLKSL